MQLKDYQNDVLESFSQYLRVLAARRQTAEEYAKFQKSQGVEGRLRDYCRETWEDLAGENRIPTVRDRSGNAVVRGYVPRKDGLDRPIPNICLKVPTGGGKTLLACASLERINAEYFRKQTGFVLWVVPSDAIYAQTWKAFANREHPYRQMLERASGGRVRLLERGDSFTRQDVDEHLCVLLLMLQASARRTKEQLKMFQDSGQFPSFFPDPDDSPGNKALLKDVRNLDLCNIGDEEYRAQWLLTPRQSLGNVLRMVRPVVVIDEGHKAYSDIALQTLAGFNPRFILELSATPNSGGEHVSNVLVDVSGRALQKEEMIKLPINLINTARADWKHTLAEAKEKLDELQKAAERVQGNEGRYIRPILLIRVERTGKEQRDKAAIHSEDAREYLIERLGAHPEEVKVKSAELDELGDQDLRSELCKVRYIITKDALREGWDCPFAYVLAILSKTTALTALTQMVGRVMRQPGAEATSEPSLNECYVFTFDQEVQSAVDCVRRGLAEEGMGDLAESVRAGGKEAALGSRRETIRRREKFRGTRIFLPRVLCKGPDGQMRLFDYDRDLLSRLDWDQFSYTQRAHYEPDEKEALERTMTRVSMENLGNVDDTELPKVETVAEDVEPELDFPALVRLLLDVIPNPWQGARILEETLESLRKRGISEKRLFTNRLFLVKAMRDDLKGQVHRAGEAKFHEMLAQGDIAFRLEASNDERLNWELAETLELDITDEDRLLHRKSGEPLERSLLEKVYQKQLNGLEKDVAWYLDAEKAVRWWHRIAVHQDWHLQGWQRNRVYPDFLVCIEHAGNGKVRLSVLETKGLHLKGSEDTEYKRKLFELLTRHLETALSVGELKLGMGRTQMRFEMLLENDWREKLHAAMAG